MSKSEEAKAAREKAAELWEEQIKEDPQDAEAHNQLGITLRALGKYEEAKSAYERANEISPSSVDGGLWTRFPSGRRFPKSVSQGFQNKSKSGLRSCCFGFWGRLDFL